MKKNFNYIKILLFVLFSGGLIWWWLYTYQYSPTYYFYEVNKNNEVVDSTKIYIISPRETKRQIVDKKDTSYLLYHKNKHVITVDINDLKNYKLKKIK